MLKALPIFTRLTPTGPSWADGAPQDVDAVIWCTGFRPALRHLRSLGLPTEHGRIAVGGPTGTQALAEERLYLVGYGDWTGLPPRRWPAWVRRRKATAAAVTSRLSP